MTTLYNCRTGHNGFMMAKFDSDFNVAGIYTITTKANAMICDCPGWPRREVCKHTRMVNIFALAGLIDTNTFYCYEAQSWHRPIAGPWDQDEPSARKAAEVADAVGPSIVTDKPAKPHPRAHAQSLDGAIESGAIKIVAEPPKFNRRV